ncbi:MAG TPA: glycosyltransferase family 4 protein [Candidatus Nanopelagicales bacterium]|nr:glycosyltransferase family 4 protein [Candidatus Nanopelagicales bacterium]
MLPTYRVPRGAGKGGLPEATGFGYDGGMPKLRIVHTVSSLHGGGMEHFVLRLVETQRGQGHDASILALRSGPLEGMARDRGLPTTVLQGNKIERIARAGIAFGVTRPHIIHAHNPTSLHYATVGKLLGRARLVYTDHAQTRGIIRVPSQYEWRQCDAVIGCSKDTADRCGAVGIVHPIHVIHNGIEIKPATKTREQVRAELGLGGEYVGIMPAAFHRVKGHDILLRAIAALRDEELDLTATADPRAQEARVRVLVAGDGDERDRIHGLAKELKLGPEWVTFLGFRKDVPELLAGVDFFVLPSRMEGLPLSILEAMARRLPVVVTPVGGVPEVVTDGEHGLIVPVEDPRALGEAIGRLAEDPELGKRFGEAGARRVEEEFSFVRMARKYEDLYLRVLEAQPTGIAGRRSAAGGAA